MSKKTYELCFDEEGLRIIPIGEDQVSVQILSEEADENILTDETEVDILEEQDSQALFLTQQQSLLEDEGSQELDSLQGSDPTSQEQHEEIKRIQGGTTPLRGQSFRSISHPTISGGRLLVPGSLKPLATKLVAAGSAVPVLSQQHLSQIQQLQVGRLPQHLFSNETLSTSKLESSPNSLSLAQVQPRVNVHNAAHPSPRISRQIPLSPAVKKEVVTQSNFSLEYGSSWVNDLLDGMLSDWNTTSDFPVYCADGIAWSSRIIIGSLNAQLRNVLLEADEDSCLILPQVTKNEFDTFMEFILRKETEFSKETVLVLIKVGEVFDFPLRYIDLDSQDQVNSTIDYPSIFSNQKEEFIQRICKQTDLANVILESLKSRGDNRNNNHRNNQQINRQSHLQDLDPFNILRNEVANIEGYECEECSRIIPSEEALQSHKETVHSTHKTLKKQYSCPNCGKKFSFLSNIYKHQMLVHKATENNPHLLNNTDILLDTESSDRLSPPTPSEKTKANSKSSNPSVVCKVCGITCKNRRSLVAHNQKHYGRLHECHVAGCGKRFTESSKLRRHMVVHTKEKNFLCPLCKKRFTLLQNVKSHVKNHHKMSVAQRSAVIREIVEASGGHIKTKMRDADHEMETE